jgi:hypothetical protein
LGEQGITGKTTVRWAEVVDGMMAAAFRRLCLPFKSAYEVGGDLKTEAMTELFRVCHAALGDNVWVEKPAICKCIRNSAKDNDALHGSASRGGTKARGQSSGRLFAPTTIGFWAGFVFPLIRRKRTPKNTNFSSAHLRTLRTYSCRTQIVREPMLNN